MRLLLTVAMTFFVSCGACADKGGGLLNTPDSSNNENNENNDNNPTSNGTNNDNNDAPPCGAGAVVGLSCAPSGEPLAANITLTGVDCATGEMFERTTETANDGVFEFMNVPTGQHELLVESGSFSGTSQVDIQDGMTTDLTMDNVCVGQSVSIAVIAGAYDHVEGLLDELGLPYTVVGDDLGNAAYAQRFLTDLTELNGYDIVFINCGEFYDRLVSLDPEGEVRADIAANLSAYVAEGGSIYVSDWSAPIIEDAFPEMLDLFGDDTDRFTYRHGYAPQSIDATVMSPELVELLGGTEVAIDFPQDVASGIVNNNWVVAEGAGPDAVVHIQGEAQLCGTSDGVGTCSESTQTQPDSPLLVTYTAPSGGRVMYTSFHNERQNSLSDDMERILRYLIFTL